MTITSPQNSRVKLARNLLAHTKVRRQEEQFVIEGRRLVEDALAAGQQLLFALYRAGLAADDPNQTVLEQLQAADVECAAVEPTLFDEVSDTETPQGLLAVCAWPDIPLPEPLSLLLVLDGVRNPGNLGSALRSAVAAGADGVALTPGSVDPYNPKVVRGAMGAHFRLPVVQWDWEMLVSLNVRLVVADRDGPASIYATDFTAPTALVIGGEAHGPQRRTLQMAETVVHIPMQGGESLNAAMAASVILYEAYRQRHAR